MNVATQTNTKKPKIKLDFKDSKYATGRRKKSIAKVWVKKGTGKIYVNGRTMDEYFTSGAHKMQITRSTGFELEIHVCKLIRLSRVKSTFIFFFFFVRFSLLD
jgi:hypothetical protein